VTHDEFLSRFGAVFENRPDLAAEAWDRHGPVDESAGAEGMHRAFVAGLPPAPSWPSSTATPTSPRVGAAWRSHARLAARAGLGRPRWAGRGRGRPVAGVEQGLPRALRFPFIMAVRGGRPAEILTALETRLDNRLVEERAEAVRQVERILLLRLKDRLGEA
jgi:2-oxo-4-hydroxy-4-carboxy--5-ureidoimidazoline (OHCU) decarboxylase